jgi:hypothetical protein
MTPLDPEKPEDAALIRIAEAQPEYNTLPARVTEDGEVYTVWTFSDEEKAAIAEGKPLHLRVLTFGYALQPVGMAIEGTRDYESFYE